MNHREALRLAMQADHEQVERHPFARALINGPVDLDTYAQYLAGLAPVYEALEAGLVETQDPRVTPLVLPGLFRSDHLNRDLAYFGARPWEPGNVPIVEKLNRWSREAPHCLAGVAYVRYMGDMSGGQVIRKSLRKHADLPDDALHFYDFQDVSALRTQFVGAVNSMTLTAPEQAAMIEASRDTFLAQADLFDQLWSQASGSAPDEPTSELRILLAEDDPISAKVASRLLKMRGATVLHAVDGEAAIDQFRKQIFDLVVLDISMPGMDGLQVARLAREHERSRGQARTPMVALTAYGTDAHRTSTLHAGIDEHLLKPVTGDMLAGVIARHCSKGA